MGNQINDTSKSAKTVKASIILSNIITPKDSEAVILLLCDIEYAFKISPKRKNKIPLPK